MMKSVTGAQGIEDDLVFLRVFEIILSRLVPEDEDELIAKAAGNQYNLAKMKKRQAFQTAHSNVYARCPMGYTDCFNTYNSSRRMCIEE